MGTFLGAPQSHDGGGCLHGGRAAARTAASARLSFHVKRLGPDGCQIDRNAAERRADQQVPRSTSTSFEAVSLHKCGGVGTQAASPHPPKGRLCGRFRLLRRSADPGAAVKRAQRDAERKIGREYVLLAHRPY